MENSHILFANWSHLFHREKKGPSDCLLPYPLSPYVISTNSPPQKAKKKNLFLFALFCLLQMPWICSLKICRLSSKVMCLVPSSVSRVNYKKVLFFYFNNWEQFHIEVKYHFICVQKMNNHRCISISIIHIKKIWHTFKFIQKILTNTKT